MIICQTPFRISFFGGGTDYPAWYRENGGAVLSTTMNKYSYISCRRLPPFFEHKHRIVYSQIESTKDIDSINHPAVREVFRFMEVNDGLELHYDGDLPARSGIGSSSTFTVGLLNTLYAMRGEIKSKHELSQLAIHIEQNIIGETVGSQDQVAAAYGGFNKIEFRRDGRIDVKPVIMPPDRAEEFNDNLMLFFTGFSRIAETVAKSKVANFKSQSAQLNTMHAMVDQAQNILQSPNADLDDLGRMLDEAWQLKRNLSDKVSNGTIDDLYMAGRKSGAIGGKILGAGGGGFLLFYVPKERQQQVRETLSHLIEVDFRFEYKGSQIMLYNPERTIYPPQRNKPVFEDKRLLV